MIFIDDDQFQSISINFISICVRFCQTLNLTRIKNMSFLFLLFGSVGSRSRSWLVPFSLPLRLRGRGNSGSSGTAMAPKLSKPKAAFRFDRKQFGLTWSCPTDKAENPIQTKEEILTLLKSKGELKHYTIGKEKHESGKNHFHALAIYQSKIESTNAKFFNVAGVQANIQNRGMSWDWYPQKDGDFITSGQCVYREALSARNPEEALEIMYKKRPREMVLQGHNVERNLRRRLEKNDSGFTVKDGPYPEWLYPTFDWNPKEKSLLIWGLPGTYKTHFAMYLLKHMGFDPEYLKSASHETGAMLSMKRAFVYDELDCWDPKCVPSNSKEITDVENGGTVQCRHKNYRIPPGLPRIFVSNSQRPFQDPNQAVYDRRVLVWPKPALQDYGSIEDGLVADALLM